MTTLILCTSLSQLFVRISIRELMRDSNTLVVCINPQVHMELKKINISAFYLSPQQRERVDWGERDSNFRRIFMEGEQLKCNFPDTDLPVWKVAALDRFSFWFTDRESAELYDLIMALDWDRAIVSADLHSDLCWTLARYSGRTVWGVKTSGFRTREWYDLGATVNIPFAGIYVGSESDKVFLSKIAQDITAEIVTI